MQITFSALYFAFLITAPISSQPLSGLRLYLPKWTALLLPYICAKKNVCNLIRLLSRYLSSVAYWNFDTQIHKLRMVGFECWARRNKWQRKTAELWANKSARKNPKIFRRFPFSLNLTAFSLAKDEWWFFIFKAQKLSFFVSFLFLFFFCFSLLLK